ncbi:unnamed protein product [Camellia sinensis]
MSRQFGGYRNPSPQTFYHTLPSTDFKMCSTSNGEREREREREKGGLIFEIRNQKQRDESESERERGCGLKVEYNTLSSWIKFNPMVNILTHG